MPADLLKTVLLDLLYELRDSNLPLLVGGGYGLFVKQEHLARYDQDPITVPLPGTRSNGQSFEAQVLVPQGFTYVMMKLFAFRDRRDDRNQDMARHHALDLYRTIAMLTEAEHDRAWRLAMEYRDGRVVREATGLVWEFFSDVTALGLLRIREHPLFSENMDVKQFLEVLQELLPKE